MSDEAEEQEHCSTVLKKKKKRFVNLFLSLYVPHTKTQALWPQLIEITTIQTGGFRKAGNVSPQNVSDRDPLAWPAQLHNTKLSILNSKTLVGLPFP